MKSHYTWLRLIVTTALLSCVRNKNNRVTFILDECYALGYLEELETAFGSYAGFEVTLWAIFQSLSQIKALYGPNLAENIVGSSTVSHWFGVRDHDTASYVSSKCGMRSVPTYSGIPKKLNGSTARALITPDEIRITEEIITFIDSKYPALLPKFPYYENPAMAGLYDPNPYYKPDDQGNSGEADKITFI